MNFAPENGTQATKHSCKKSGIKFPDWHEDTQNRHNISQYSLVKLIFICRVNSEGGWGVSCRGFWAALCEVIRVLIAEAQMITEDRVTFLICISLCRVVEFNIAKFYAVVPFVT